MEALELQRSHASGNDSHLSSIEEPDLSDQDINESHLPPVDQGKDAWLFLTSCFFVEALIWGKTTNLPLLFKQCQSDECQDSPFHSVSFKTTIVHMSHSLMKAKLLLSAQRQL